MLIRATYIKLNQHHVFVAPRFLANTIQHIFLLILLIMSVSWAPAGTQEFSKCALLLIKLAMQQPYAVTFLICPVFQQGLSKLAAMIWPSLTEAAVAIVSS